MKDFDINLKTLGLLLLVIPVPALTGYYLIKNLHKDFSSLGSFGDFVAGTTVPVLTFISFLALVLTLRLQSEQLNIQNEEMQLTRKEMQDTRKEFELQNETMAIQRFENTFFQMINLHNDIVNNINYEESRDSIKGRASFKHLSEDFTVLYMNKKEHKLENDFINKNEIDRIRITYCKFFSHFEDRLGHYFRNLYRIVKFIDESNSLISEDKKTYIGILRAQLSSYELVLLLYNSLDINNHKSLLLIFKYNLLDGINKNLLAHESHLTTFTDEAKMYINK